MTSIHMGRQDAPELARLIAEAPAMLEALRAINELVRDNPESGLRYYREFSDIQEILSRIGGEE